MSFSLKLFFFLQTPPHLGRPLFPDFYSKSVKGLGQKVCVEMQGSVSNKINQNIWVLVLLHIPKDVFLFFFCPHLKSGIQILMPPFTLCFSFG